MWNYDMKLARDRNEGCREVTRDKKEENESESGKEMFYSSSI